MPLTATVKLTKPNKSVRSFFETHSDMFEMGELLTSYDVSGKILKGPTREISEDGLIETITITFDSSESYDEFRLSDVNVKHREKRRIWCETNNASCDVSTVVE